MLSKQEIDDIYSEEIEKIDKYITNIEELENYTKTNNMYLDHSVNLKRLKNDLIRKRNNLKNR